MLLRSRGSPASMERTRRHRVLAVLLVVLSVLPDLGSCNGVEQGGTLNPEEGIGSASQARIKIIHGDRTRKFLREQQQNRYWAVGHFGNKASASLTDVTTTDQWPPWLPWASNDEDTSFIDTTTPAVQQGPMTRART